MCVKSIISVHLLRVSCEASSVKVVFVASLPVAWEVYGTVEFRRNAYNKYEPTYSPAARKTLIKGMLMLERNLDLL